MFFSLSLILIPRKIFGSINPKAISRTQKLKIDFGGGIKTDEDIKNVFSSGANQATVGTIAITDKKLFIKWLNTYGSEKLILGADVKDGQIAVSGWLEVSKISLNDFVTDYMKEGVQYILCTDISKDGMLQGTAMELYKELQLKFPSLKFIASGGITNIDEIYELDKSGVYGVIVGKAIYEGRISMQQLKSFRRP
jgi:phosphoribosylformimino-5-aminoimidazole carboxamide ribotide isomerase